MSRVGVFHLGLLAARALGERAHEEDKCLGCGSPVRPEQGWCDPGLCKGCTIALREAEDALDLDATIEEMRRELQEPQ